MARPFYKNLTVQVLTAVAIGLTIGYVKPAWGQALQPLGDGFIRLIKMVVGPIIFLTVVCGIASAGSIGKVGRVGGKALLYFEIITTLALAIGMVVANVVRPGTSGGQGIALVSTELPAETEAEGSAARRAANKPDQPDDDRIAQYTKAAKKQSFVDFVLHVIPTSIAAAFAEENLLQILFFAVIFGIALSSLGARESTLMAGLEQLSEVMFRIVAMIMKVAPLGALGAMAYTVGTLGIESLGPLVKLMACVYLTMALFIFVGLGIVCRLFGFSLWRYLRFIREEIILVLGTSSSESALPRMIEKLEQFGCGRGVVKLVIPAGYSFNLDGTSIYLSMAVIFIAQAYGIQMSVWQQAYALGILMLTSKGSAAVTGGGFVTLAATLEATNLLPVAGLTLLLGVDRFMSEARAITNLIGNGVATIVISKLEGEFDQARYEAATSGGGQDIASSGQRDEKTHIDLWPVEP